jgi:stage II sporulation protein M
MILVILAGIICGALLVRFMDEEPLVEITSALNHFLDDLKEDEGNLLSAPELLRASFYKNGTILLFLWVLGLFSAGYFLVLPVLFLKGISLGFTMGIIIYRYSIKGALFCLAALLPHNLILVPAYILASAFAFTYSFYLFRNRFSKGKTEHPFLTQYCLYMSLVILITLCGMLVEAYITPVFMRLVMPVI